MSWDTALESITEPQAKHLSHLRPWRCYNLPWHSACGTTLDRSGDFQASSPQRSGDSARRDAAISAVLYSTCTPERPGSTIALLPFFRSLAGQTTRPLPCLRAVHTRSWRSLRHPQPPRPSTITPDAFPEFTAAAVSASALARTASGSILSDCAFTATARLRVPEATRTRTRWYTGTGCAAPRSRYVRRFPTAAQAKMGWRRGWDE
ncbi:hypothetical protein C8R45DRAFT_1114057 [Mycena sanguinolenta]|nr:hypothetical protein C8R45DRAFT_1114057 [Mycena sanguinolenta]